MIPDDYDDQKDCGGSSTSLRFWGFVFGVTALCCAFVALGIIVSMIKKALLH